MFLNILRISTSNVLKMFLKIIVSIDNVFECAAVIFLSNKPAGKKKNIIINKKD